MANELESVTPAGRELAGTVLEAFTRHRLVGMGESHGLQNHHDALQMLLTDPRLPAALDDIIVEFGNALPGHGGPVHSRGAPVADVDLRMVWRNTTQSPRQTWDAPVYEQLARNPGRQRDISPQPARAKDLPQGARRTRVTGLPPEDAPVPAG